MSGTPSALTPAHPQAQVGGGRVGPVARARVHHVFKLERSVHVFVNPARHLPQLLEQLGLEPRAIYNAIEQVGNYGEIYDRNLGPDTQFNIPRGLNAQWSDGGLIYGMPFR